MRVCVCCVNASAMFMCLYHVFMDACVVLLQARILASYTHLLGGGGDNMYEVLGPASLQTVGLCVSV